MGMGDWKPVDYLTETTANLGIAGIFNGASWNMGPAPTIFDLFQAIFVSDQVSASNGAKVQASDDGVTWFDVAVGTQTANVPLTLQCVPCAKFMRVKQVNGGVAQTSNRIYTSVRQPARSH